MRRLSTILVISMFSVYMMASLTPLGLGIFESGWKFSYQNPAEIYYVDKSSLSFTIVPYFGDNKEIVSWISIMQPPNSNNFAGALTFNRHSFVGSGDTYSLEYYLAGGKPFLVWGVKIATEYMVLSSATDYSLKVSFGIDGLYKNLKYGFSIEDLYLYSTNPSIYMMGKYVAAVGIFTKSYALHAGVYSLNFEDYGGYLGAALDLSLLAFGGNIEYLYDVEANKGYFGYQLGMVINIDYISIGGAYGSFIEPVDLAIPFTQEGKNQAIMFSFDIRF